MVFPEIISFVNFGERDLRPIVDVEQRLIRQGIPLKIDDTWPDARTWEVWRLRRNTQKEAVVKAALEVEKMGFETEYRFAFMTRPTPKTRRPEILVRRYRRRR